MQDNQRQTHWAYIAGIMDADGCFMIAKQTRKTNNKKTKRALDFPKKVDKWSTNYLGCVKIAMIEPEAIEFIMNEMGFGNFNLDGARKDRPKSKPIYHWYLRNKYQIIVFLEGIIPYLKVKKQRAEHLLEYCKNLVANPNPSYRGLSKEELDYRQHAYIKARKLNGNEVAATTKS